MTMTDAVQDGAAAGPGAARAAVEELAQAGLLGKLGGPGGAGGLGPTGEGGVLPAMGKAGVGAGLLDKLVAQAGTGELALTGEGGFLPEMVKAVLERGLAAELTGHLGYEKGDPAGRGTPNARNGTTPKILDTEVGPVPLAVPRD